MGREGTVKEGRVSYFSVNTINAIAKATYRRGSLFWATVPKGESIMAWHV